MTRGKIVFAYHGGCWDGFGARYAATKFFESCQALEGFDVKYVAVTYSDKTVEDYHPDVFVSRALIIFGDFCPPLEVLRDLKSRGCFVLILDHHKTAQSAVAEFPDFFDHDGSITVDPVSKLLRLWSEATEGHVFKVFDMNRSGAAITYDFFYFVSRSMLRRGTRGHITKSRLIDYIEDRDLWKFELHESEAVNAYIQSHPMTVASFTALDAELGSAGFENAVKAGRAILRYQKGLINTVINRGFSQVRSSDGVKVQNVAVLSLSLLQSEIGNEILSRSPEVDIVCMMDCQLHLNRIMISFRSRSGSAVSCLPFAEKLGGGGHPSAAGVVVSLSDKKALRELTNMGFITEQN